MILPVVETIADEKNIIARRDGNISSLETKAGEDILLSFAYQYDGNGNRTVKVGTQTSAALGGITAGNNALDISYHYDVRGQLLEERRNGASVCYAYDKAGNRIRETDSKGATIYQFNRKNQLTAEEGSSGKKQFTYDRQGGIVEEKSPAGIRRFSYDSRHRQTRVETENGSVQENRYDAEGLRFELLEKGKRTSFVYHNGELLHEEGREAGQTSYHLGVGIDAFKRGQDIFYCHRDEQLSTMFVTGREGVIQNSYQYDAFGAEIEANEQFSNRIRYTGQQYDELTGQYYLRARYYNPILGRFMQEDVYQGDGLNLYAYCHNNPVRGILDFLCPSAQDGGDGGKGETSVGEPEVYYRTMSKEDYDYLRMTGEIPATGETFISPTISFSSNYDGIMVEFYVNAGTTNLLEEIGVSNGDRASLAREVFPDMPFVSGINWTENYAFFKAEGEQINIGLGKGLALEIFNRAILFFRKVIGQ